MRTSGVEKAEKHRDLCRSSLRRLLLPPRAADTTVSLDDDKYGGDTSAFASLHSNFSEPIAGYFFSNESLDIPEPHYLQYE